MESTKALSIDSEFIRYQELLTQLKGALDREKKCQEDLESATAAIDRDLKPEGADGGLGYEAPESKQNSDRLFVRQKECETALSQAEQKVDQLKKAIAKTEEPLLDTLSGEMIKSIIVLQKQHAAIGGSKLAGAALIEMVGQLQEAKSTDELRLIQESMLSVLTTLSVDNDRLQVDTFLRVAENALRTLKEADPKEAALVAQEVRLAGNDFNKRAQAMIKKIDAEKIQKQEAIQVRQTSLKKFSNELHHLQDQIKRLSGQAESAPDLSDRKKNVIEGDLQRAKVAMASLEEKIDGLEDELQEMQETLATLNAGAKKIKVLTKKVDELTHLPVFKKGEQSPLDKQKNLDALHEKMLELCGLGLNKTLIEMRSMGLQETNQFAVNECIKNCAKLGLIQFSKLSIAEGLQDEVAKNLLKEVVLSTLLSGLSLYTGIGGPESDMIKLLQRPVTGMRLAKKAHDFVATGGESSAPDITLLAKLSQYVKDNRYTVVGGGTAVTAFAVILFTLFPPTTALGLFGLGLSGGSMAKELKKLVSLTIKEIEHTSEISKTLDKHQVLLDALAKEAKSSLKEEGGLKASQELLLLLGENPLFSVAPSKSSGNTLAIFSGLDAEDKIGLEPQKPPDPIKPSVQTVSAPSAEAKNDSVLKEEQQETPRMRRG